jgi:hypothetical protein
VVPNQAQQTQHTAKVAGQPLAQRPVHLFTTPDLRLQLWSLFLRILFFETALTLTNTHINHCGFSLLASARRVQTIIQLDSICQATNNNTNSQLFRSRLKDSQQETF